MLALVANCDYIKYIATKRRDAIPFNLREWQARHAFTYNTAAQALGFDRATYARYLNRPQLPRWLILACKAIDLGVEI